RPARALYAAHAERAAESGAGRGRHPRRAAEGRRPRGRGGPRSGRGHRSFSEREVRCRLFQRREVGHGSRDEPRLLVQFRQLASRVFLAAAASSASLVLARLAPGDYITESLGTQANRQTVAEMRARYGLDKPIAVQYRDWLAAAVRLDFGRSMQFDRPVRDLIPERAANTAILALSALVLATAIGVPLGIVAGSRRGGVI